MSSHEAMSLQLKPIISYPREAQVGKTYLMSIDVQFNPHETDWDFPEEEYTIGFIVNAHPYFACKPLHGEGWPEVMLHRFGGTYGPAEILLTAADHTIDPGHITITLVNGWGIPMATQQLPCEVKQESEAREGQKEITITARQEASARINMHLEEPPPMPLSAEEQEERERFDRLAAMLGEAGWFVVDENDTIAFSAGAIVVKSYPSSTDRTDTNFLLLLDGEAVGIVMKEGADGLLETLNEVLSNHPAGLIIQSSEIHAARDPLPFVYEMHGEEIHFTNNLEPDTRSRIVFHFHRPETLTRWLRQAPAGMPNELNDLLRSRLHRMPSVSSSYLQDDQIAAITNLEQSLAQNRPRALLQMTSYTYAIMYSIYRLLRFGGAERILYLVDSEETLYIIFEALSHFVIPDLKTDFMLIYKTYIGPRQLPVLNNFVDFDNLYVISIEQLYKSLSENSEDTADVERAVIYHTTLPIESFDIVFFEDCFDKLHGQYRSLLDYFDAFLVGVGDDIPPQVMGLFNRNLVYKDPSTDVIVRRLWNYCDVLRDDVPSEDYVEQLTYLLFLKMTDERTEPPFHSSPRIPVGYDWQSLLEKSGMELITHYDHTLERLGQENGMLGIIFRKASNKLREPAKLHHLIVDLINPHNWSNLESNAIGNAYDILLAWSAENNRNMGQYFTSRTLIKAIVDVMQPEPDMRICDPACGTGGLLLVAHDYITQHHQLTRKQAETLKNGTFYGWEIADNIARLCAMNLFLHNIGSDDATTSSITVGNSLLKPPSNTFDMVLCDPPIGVRTTIENQKRPDFLISTNNGELNFIQHIVTLLKPHGRAAIVLPDGVLFRRGAAERLWTSLLRLCNVHTLLRLPAGILYHTGIPTDVLFFDRMPSSDKPWTKELWIYDFRTSQKFSHSNPFTREHLDDFVRSYHPENRHDRKETEYFRKFSYEELTKQDKRNFRKDDQRMTTLPDLTFYQALDQDLIPVVIQHWQSLEVLMLGTMSKESLALTLENDIVYLYALSREEIWLKGEKSGIHLKVKEIRVNCNNSNLLILVDYPGNICHTGARTCFYRRLAKRDENWVWEEIEEEQNL